MELVLHQGRAQRPAAHLVEQGEPLRPEHARPRGAHEDDLSALQSWLRSHVARSANRSTNDRFSADRAVDFIDDLARALVEVWSRLGLQLRKSPLAAE